MQIQRVNLDHAGKESDTSVVIDVLRAFTTAAYALAAGALEILPVSTLEEAFALHKELDDALLMGERHGYPIGGFDLGNSPSALANQDLSNQRIIHRSTAGTQGIVRSAKSEHILAASLCCMSATVHAIREINPGSLTLVETGRFKGGWGDEDVACADLIEAMLLGEPIQPHAIIQRVRDSKSGRHFSDPNDLVFPSADLELAVQLDRFDFAMQITRENDHLVLRKRGKLK
jgi:2-phosphosulfolactate phosphatase